MTFTVARVSQVQTGAKTFLSLFTWIEMKTLRWKNGRDRNNYTEFPDKLQLEVNEQTLITAPVLSKKKRKKHLLTRRWTLS